MESIYYPDRTDGRIRRVLYGDALALDDGAERQRVNDDIPLNKMNRYDDNIRRVCFMEYVEGLYDDYEGDDTDNYRTMKLSKSKKRTLFNIAMRSLLYDNDADDDDFWSQYIQYRYPTFEGKTVFVHSGESSYRGWLPMFTIKLRAES